MTTIQSETTKKIIKIVSGVVISVLLAKLFMSGYNTYKNYNHTKKNIICPSLLSISRSARDTLIVMKAESLCNNYVLDNLK